jgi:hemoglobin/transferrin/lactoferrin receptor protein
MKNIFPLLWLGLAPFFLSAQTLTVRDLATRSPLEFATVNSPSIQDYAVTDQRGRADISAFTGADTVIVRLLGYQTAVFSYEELNSLQFTVFIEPTGLSLDEIVVSAIRWKESKRDVPSKITTILKRDVQLQNPQTAADLLGASGDVFIQKSQLGGGSPMIRGFATNRVLLTVDGVRMNNAIFRSGNIQNVISVDPLAVERTEVLFGPGAVMYGSDAIGGAMNFYTLTPQLSDAEKPYIKGNAAVRYATANDEKTGHLDFNLGFRKWAFVTSASYSDFSDLKAGSRGPDEFLRPDYQTRIDGRDTVLQNPDPRIQRLSGYSQFNLMQKIRFAPDERWDFQYGFHYSATSDAPRYDRLIERDSRGVLRDGQWYYGPQVWMMNVLNVSHSAENLFFDNFRFTLAQQHFEESRHNRNFNGSALNHRTEKVDAFSLNLDFDKKLSEKRSLLYGAEAVVNRITSLAERENINTGAVGPLSTRYPDGSHWTSISAYGNFLNKISEKLTFQAGLRYNQIFLDATFDTAFFPFPFTEARVNSGALTGSAGLAFSPTLDWQFNANLSTGFRAPNIDDIGKVFDSEPGAVIVPNPGLKSEYAYNAEVGVSRIFGKTVKADITGFYTILSNALVRREFTLNGQDSIVFDGQLSRVLAIQNAANAFVYGIQASLELKLPLGFGLISRFTYQTGEEELDEGGKAPLRHAVPWFGVTRLTYSRKRLTADLYAMYQSAVNYEEMAPSEQAKAHLYAIDADGNPYSPQWLTLNFKAMYQVADFLTVNAGVENIADVRYRPYSSGISAPGRNFVVSLRMGF